MCLNYTCSPAMQTVRCGCDSRSSRGMPLRTEVSQASLACRKRSLSSEGLKASMRRKKPTTRRQAGSCMAARREVSSWLSMRDMDTSTSAQMPCTPYKHTETTFTCVIHVYTCTCLFDLACFFLPSFSSLINICMSVQAMRCT